MHQLTLAEIARGLADKKFSSEELTKTLLARIAQLDPQLNSFITLTEDLAVEGEGRAGGVAKLEVWVEANSHEVLPVYESNGDSV